MQFDTGDLVRRKGDDRVMAVVSVHVSEELVFCVWPTSRGRQRHAFPQDELESATRIVEETWPSLTDLNLFDEPDCTVAWRNHTHASPCPSCGRTHHNALPPK